MRHITYHDQNGVCFAEGYSIYRHETMMSQKPGTYAIIANLELAAMQGAKHCHIAAVPDDFGNLVAVPGGWQCSASKKPSSSTASIARSTRHCVPRAWRGCSPGTEMDCPSGKVVHTLRTATESAKRARRRTETPLAPYRCAFCGAWHVGQKSGLKRPVKTIYDNHQLRFT